MKIQCPGCNSFYHFYGNRAEQLRKGEMNCPCCGQRMEPRPIYPALKPGRVTGGLMSCAILSSGNRLQLFDIPCPARSKNADSS